MSQVSRAAQAEGLSLRATRRIDVDPVILKPNDVARSLQGDAELSLRLVQNQPLIFQRSQSRADRVSVPDLIGNLPGALEVSGAQGRDPVIGVGDRAGDIEQMPVCAV